MKILIVNYAKKNKNVQNILFICPCEECNESCFLPNLEILNICLDCLIKNIMENKCIKYYCHLENFQHDLALH